MNGREDRRPRLDSPLARLFSWWVPVAVIAAFLLPNVVPEALVGFAAMAVGTLVLAWALWRLPEVVWDRGGASAGGAELAERG